MPLNLEYVCQDCGTRKYASEMKSMLCKCGGDFRADGMLFKTHVSRFEPHYCPTLKKYLTSWAHQEREAKKFRSPRHPEGLVLANDNKKLIKKCKEIVKNREEIIKETYAKDGINYPKGENVNYSDQKGCFVHRGTDVPFKKKAGKIKKHALRISDKVKMKVAALIFLTLMTGTSYAGLEEIKHIEVKVNGESHFVPIHEPEFTEEKAVLWLKALDGDIYSRRVILGNQKEAYLFMGDGTKVKWLRLTENKEEVITP